MIKKITIRDVASYDSEGVVLDDLQKVNFVFGGNGTGKTTISRVLGTDSLHYDYPHCEVKWDGEEYETYVYNKDFKENNLRESIPGVFSIGAEWVNLDKQMETHRELRKKYVERVNVVKEQLHKKEAEWTQVEATLRDDLWEKVYIPHKDFKECLKGYARKKSFLEHICHEVNERAGELKLKSQGKKLEDVIDNYKEWAMERMTDIKEMKALYHEIYEGEAAQVGMDNPQSERIMYEREKLNRDLWYYMSEMAYDDIVKANNELKGIKISLKRLRRDYDKAIESLSMMDTSLRGTEKLMARQQPAIDSINRSLQDLKFRGFSIQPSPLMKGHYQIQREDGSYVRGTLSEGEETFIAFLYLMQLAKGSVLDINVKNPRILVVDDPICSLDGSVLLEVSKMLKDLIEEVLTGNGCVKQVFILTHNTEFHRLLSQRKRNDEVHYYKLVKRGGVTRVLSYGIENPVKSDYETQWEELRMLKAGHSVPNAQTAMRKILEAYFVRLGGYNKYELIEKYFSDNAEERIVGVTLLKLMDEGSHGASDDFYVGDMDEVNWRYLEVFKRLFEKSGHLAHYEMMMREE
jgi:wobble nucleotide-excising tRNase